MTNISTAHKKRQQKVQSKPHSLTDSPKILVGISLISELIIKCVFFVQIFSQQFNMQSRFPSRISSRVVVQTRLICLWHNYKLSASSFLALLNSNKMTRYHLREASVSYPLLRRLNKKISISISTYIAYLFYVVFITPFGIKTQKKKLFCTRFYENRSFRFVCICTKNDDNF